VAVAIFAIAIIVGIIIALAMTAQFSDASARQLVRAAGSTALWNARQGEWTATLPHGAVIGWSDARSWLLRVALARSYHLHGLALWSLGLSDPLPHRHAAL
jgi:spore germination protein